MKVYIDQIDVGDRIRQDKGKDWDQFVRSFLKFGQIQPVKVEKNEAGRYQLIAGWRRLTAISLHHAAGTPVRGLAPNEVEITFSDPVPVHTRLLQEFAENEERSDFTFLEKARFIRRFHEMMVLDYGSEHWTQELTAHALNLSPASISHYLRVEEAAKLDESIAKAQTLDAAVKRMKVNERVKERIDTANREDSGVIDRANAILNLGDARTWIKDIEDGSVDLVNFDPPWGDNASHKSAENHEEFDDSSEYADDLMASLFPHIFRILKPDRFCVFWHRLWATERMAAMAETHGFNLQFTRTPCIWYKPDKIADQNRFPEKQLIDCYEPFYLLRKGDPIFHERFAHNVFTFPRVPLGSLIHPTEKPLDLNTAIIRLCTVPGETVVDPTAGSSSVLDASVRSNRRARGCELSDKFHERGIARLAEYLKTFSEK